MKILFLMILVPYFMQNCDNVVRVLCPEVYTYWYSKRYWIDLVESQSIQMIQSGKMYKPIVCFSE